MNIKNIKPTGIVRRIDDLGRIVIPKEIRKTLRIREGDPLEIFTGDEGMICIRKYDMIETPEEIIDTFEESINELDFMADMEAETKKQLFNKIDEIKKILEENKKEDN